MSYKDRLLQGTSVREMMYDPFRNPRIVRAPEGDDKGGGADGDNDKPPEFDLQRVVSHPDTKKIVTDWAEREIVAPLKTKNKELLDKLTKYKTKNDKGEEVYIDPTEAINAIEQVRSGKTKSVEEEVTRAVKASEDRYKGQIADLENRLKDRDSQVNTERGARHRLMITNNLRSSLLASQVKDGKMHLHEKFLIDFLSVDVDNGKERVVVKDSSGNIRYGSSGIMTVDEFITEYREKNKDVQEDWRPSIKSGSGTQPGSSGNRGGVVIDQNLNPVERMKAARRIAR